MLEIKVPDVDLVDPEREALLQKNKVMQAVMMISKLPKRETKLCKSMEVKNFFCAGHFFDRYYKECETSSESNECESEKKVFFKLYRLARKTRDIIVEAFPFGCPHQFLNIAKAILNWCTHKWRSQGIATENLLKADQVLGDAEKIVRAVCEIQRCSVQRGHRLDIEKLQEDIQKKKQEIIIYDLQKQIRMVQKQIENLQEKRGIKRKI